jgi:TRAP-type C4-dicarboxylate transport system substrate-binding protein
MEHAAGGCRPDARILSFFAIGREEIMNRRIMLGAALADLLVTPLAAEPIVLKLNSPAPPWSYVNKEVLGPWAEAVTAASDGTLQVQTFYGGTLGNFGNTYDRVVDQVVDVGFILFAFASGKFKQQDVAALPFETETSIASSIALWSIYEKGITAKEFDAVKPLGLWTFPNAAIHSREPIRTLDDFKGKKLIASNAIAAKMIPALGATPISFRPDEAYTAIQRGTTDGVLMPFTGMETFKVHEVTKYHLDVALGGDAAMLFIGRQRYDALPAKAKEAIDRNSYLPLTRKLGEKTQEQWEKSRNLVRDQVSTLGPVELAEWKKRLAPVTAEWAQSVPDGAKVLEAFRAAVAAQGTK